MEDKIIALLKEHKRHVAIQLYKNAYGVSQEEAETAVEVIEEDVIEVEPTHISDTGFHLEEVNQLIKYINDGYYQKVEQYLLERYPISFSEAEYITEQLAFHQIAPMPYLNSSCTQSVLDLLKKGEKIQAIKMYRTYHPAKLKEAKLAVDLIELIANN